MFLTISDKLQDLNDALETEDNFHNARRKGRRRGISEQMMEDIEIGQFKFRQDTKGKNKAHDLRGPEKLKLFKNFDRLWAILDSCHNNRKTNGSSYKTGMYPCTKTAGEE